MSAGTGATASVLMVEPRGTETEPNGNRSNYLSVPQNCISKTGGNRSPLLSSSKCFERKARVFNS